MATMAFNPRDRLHTVHGRLFQAQMWRGYAMQWDEPDYVTKPGVGVHVPRRAWVASVLRISREDCLRRAWLNVRLARRLNRRAAP